MSILRGRLPLLLHALTLTLASCATLPGEAPRTPFVVAVRVTRDGLPAPFVPVEGDHRPALVFLGPEQMEPLDLLTDAAGLATHVCEGEPDDVVVLRVRAPGCVVDAVALAPGQVAHVALAPECPVAGQLVDSRGDPVGDVRVTPVDPRRRSLELAPTTTASDGRFVLHGLAPGRDYWLVVEDVREPRDRFALPRHASVTVPLADPRVTLDD